MEVTVLCQPDAMAHWVDVVLLLKRRWIRFLCAQTAFLLQVIKKTAPEL